MQQHPRTYFQALAVLMGTIIGAGTFGIPYAFARSGFLVGVAYLAALSVVVTFMHLLYGEIALRTQQKHRLIGYVGQYLSAPWKHLASIQMVVGLFAGLTAYLILGGLFLHTASADIFPISTEAWSVVFFAVMAYFIMTDFRTGAMAELVMSAVLLALLALIVLRTLPDISGANLFAAGNARDLFLPYGVVLFALSGAAAIPELRDILKSDGRMKMTIVTGTLAAAAVYGLFAFGVVGSFGTSTPPDTIAALAGKYGAWMAVAGGIMGALIVATSFISLGLVLKHVFMYDLHMPGSIAAILVLGVPMTLFLFASRDFITIIGFSGAVLGGLEGIILLRLYAASRTRSDRTPEYALRIPRAALIAAAFLFAAGIAYEVAHVMRYYAA